MVKYKDLLREPMKTKPESKRAARQKSSSTPPHVYRMNYNESPYGMSPKAAEALAKASERPFVYPDWFSIELKSSIAEAFDMNFSNVAIGSGSSTLIDMLGEIFINAGDEVVFGDPSYEAFRDVANDYGAVPVPVPLDEDMCYNLDAMLAAITDKTKMIIVCNPNNPTGTFVDSAKVEEFVRKVPDNVITVIDEAYIDFVKKENTYSMAKLVKEGYDKPLIVLRTFSKIYGMAGLRVGYALTSPDLVEHLGKSSHAWNICTLSQIAAAEAIKDQEFVANVADINAKERTRVTEELRALGCKVYDSETNFLLFEAKVEPSTIFAKLEEQDILIGSPIGRNRVSLGTPEMNDKFIEVIKEILS